MHPKRRPPAQDQPNQRWFDRDLVVAVSADRGLLGALLVSLMQTRVMMAQRDASVWRRLVVWSSFRQQDNPELVVLDAHDAADEAGSTTPRITRVSACIEPAWPVF